ncbi:hypothetical protein HDV03_004368 [Kappamyces sp. JEL0829]|nr:hypothetical protein HDV03_004368 [Kappamyces sp. JEL0829]
MAAYQSNAQDWQRYALFDPARYTRNLVCDGNGKYNLLVLCWAPGQASPIHDHSNSHCIFKTLEGELTESLYDWPTHSDASMSLRRETTYHQNQVNYMHNSIGLHQVGNNTSVPAVSLHLYSPPITECTTFCKTTGLQRASGKICFYSRDGQVIAPKQYQSLSSSRTPRILPELDESRSICTKPALDPAPATMAKLAAAEDIFAG